jgi:hypothetical protein
LLSKPRLRGSRRRAGPGLGGPLGVGQFSGAAAVAEVADEGGGPVQFVAVLEEPGPVRVRVGQVQRHLPRASSAAGPKSFYLSQRPFAVTMDLIGLYAVRLRPAGNGGV